MDKLRMKIWRGGYMLREETAKILMMIQGAYPNYKPLDKTIAVNTWHMVLTDIPFELAQQAFLVYLRSDTSGFAPSPGQLIGIVQTLSAPKQLNELEAWTLVEKALQNSSYNSELEFSKLPLLIQKTVGAPRQLRAWATDEEYNSQVVSSNFMRVYRNELRKQEEYDRMPENLKQLVDKNNVNSYSTQIQQENKEKIESTLNKEVVKIETREKEMNISPQNNNRLQKLKTELQ